MRSGLIKVPTRRRHAAASSGDYIAGGDLYKCTFTPHPWRARPRQRPPWVVPPRSDLKSRQSHFQYGNFRGMLQKCDVRAALASYNLDTNTVVTRGKQRLNGVVGVGRQWASRTRRTSR